MSKLTNPTELIDRYLQAVRFWLPKDAQDDLLSELGEDLHSQIEEKQAEVGRAVNEDEVSAILKRCGQPMLVAARLGPQRSLIGPALFPIYRFVLQMVLFWVLVPVFLFIVGPANISSSASWTDATVATFGELFYGWFLSASIITLVFAVVERVHVPIAACKWDPRSLPPVHPAERKKSVASLVCEVMGAYLGLIWLVLLPHYPWLILGPAAVFLKAAPMLHVFYQPLVALSVIVLLRNIVIVMRPHWTRFPLPSLLIYELLMFTLLTLVLKAAGSPHGGEWYPFVVLTESARTSAQYAKVPMIVNLSILISILIWWFSTGIAIIVHAWQLLALRREKKTQPHPAASLNAN